MNDESRPRAEGGPDRNSGFLNHNALLLESALSYALRRGWSVFPCKSGGIEPVRGFKWKQEASTDPDRIREWWAEWPGANIAIVLGARSGVVIADVDDVARFKEGGLELPRTLTARTSAERGHFYYSAEGGIKGTAGAGYDLKAEGSYVIAPPSLHPSGAQYKWVSTNAPLAPVPEWVAQKAAPRPACEWSISGEPKLSPRTSRYGRIVLLSECKALAAMAPNTGRNNKLYKIAFRIGQLCAEGKIGVVDGCLDPEVSEMLRDAALACGLDQEEFQRTAPRAFVDGQRSRIQGG